MTFSRTHRTQWWRLDARQVLTITLWIALLAMSAREIADPDFWWHLKTGQYIVETRSIPRHDVFSYTATDHKWITHEWLTQVAMIGLYNLGGLAALLLATCVVVTLTFALVYTQCSARPYLAVFAVLLGALASAIAWGARPQMLNMLMAAVFLYLVHRYRAGNRHVLWFFPPLTALWTNLHSGFLLGLTILGGVVASEWLANWTAHRTERTLTLSQIRDLGLTLVASTLASLLNPNGYKMLLYPFETLGSGAMQQYIQEWASPDFHRPEYWPFAALLLAGVVVLAFTRRERDATDVLMFLGLAFAGLLSARNIPLFAVAATPIVTYYAAHFQVGRWHWNLLEPLPRRPSSGAWVWVNWILVLLLALAATVRLADVLWKNQDVEARNYPVAALEYIQANGLAEQRMYNSYNWGGYLLWRGYKVFIDGRADVYLDDFMNEYVLAYQLRGDWRRPLERYGVDYILIESGASLEALLEASDEWTRVYRDNMAVIFLRRDG